VAEEGVTMPAEGARAADALLESYRTRLGPGASFLPDRVPVIAGLVGPFGALRAAAEELPERYQQPATGVRAWLDGLFGEADPAVKVALHDADSATKAGLAAVLSFLAHTYRWDTTPPAVDRFYERELVLPAGIRGPWETLCDELGLPHVGTAWSFLFCNWQVTGREGHPYEATALPDEDLHLGCNWLRPPANSSLENFNLGFLGVEARGTAAVRHAVEAVAAAERKDTGGVADALVALADAIEAMSSQFVDRIRGSRVALEGWLDLIQPTFSWGLPDQNGQPLSGPGGMQLPSLHVLDAALTVPAGSTIAKATLTSRPYIPLPHRQFLADFDLLAPHLGQFVRASGGPDLKRRYNDALRALRHFRVAHRVQGARYLRAGGHEGQPRMSSGTGISWRQDPNRPDVEPADQFEREMLDRIVETTDALLPGAGEPPELRAPETSFRFLDRRQLRELLKLAHRRSFEPGEVIISAGDRSEAMYLVVEGRAFVVDPSAPHGPPIHTLWPGELFGELSFLGAVPAKSVVAADHVLVDALDGDVIHAVVGADAPLAAAFYRSLAVLVARRLNQDASTSGWVVPLEDGGR
jgi:hypothetical protein